ncbi:hypothetical protein [Microviridae sp.]|nr:hypothetical protein [Microviridae sp.]
MTKNKPEPAKMSFQEKVTRVISTLNWVTQGNGNEAEQIMSAIRTILEVSKACAQPQSTRP